MSLFEVRGNFSEPFQNGGYFNPNNPQIEIVASKIPTTQLVMNYTLEGDGEAVILFHLMRKGELSKTRRTSLSEEDQKITQSKFIQWTHIGLTHDVSPGTYIAILCSCAETKKDVSPFHFTVEKKEGVESVSLLPDYNRVTREGTWETYEGGYREVGKNPQYALKLKNPCFVRFTLKSVPKREMIITIAEGGAYVEKRLKQPKTIRNSECWSPVVGLTHGFTKTDTTYIISPTRGKEITTGGKYTLVLETEEDTDEIVESFEEITNQGVTEETYLECDCEDIIKECRDPDHAPFLSKNPCDELLEHMQAMQDENPGKRVVFKDSDFPGTLTSLTKDQAKWDMEQSGREYIFKRPEIFLDSPALFVNDPNPDDFQQGTIGDCWLIASLAVYCRDEEAAKERIFPAKFNPFGFYVFKFFQDQVWKYIIVDDLIPRDKKYHSYAFASSKDENELYVALMEKAFAKIWGSYHALVGNIMSNAFKYFGGEGSYHSFRMDLDHNEKDSGACWKKMVEYASKEWLMGTSFDTSDNAGLETFAGKGNEAMKSDFGLVATHAYSILNAVELSDGTQLVRLRNPWGHYEWKGDFSDKDTKNWTEERKQMLLNIVEAEKFDENDGAFWMSYKDFQSIFPELTFYSDKAYVMKHRKEFSGTYVLSDDSPDKNFHSWYSLRNPKVQVTVLEDDTKVKFGWDLCVLGSGLEERKPRMNLGIGKGKVKEIDFANAPYFVKDDPRSLYSNGWAPRDRNMDTTRILAKGDYYMVGGPSFAKEDKDGDWGYNYVIRSSKKVKCIAQGNAGTNKKKVVKKIEESEGEDEQKDVVPEEELEEVDSSMKVVKKGGYVSGNWLMYNNPKFDITLKEDGVTDLECHWKRTDKKEVYGQYSLVLNHDCPRDGKRQLGPGSHYDESRSGGYVVSNDSWLCVQLTNDKENPTWTYYVTGAKKMAGLEYVLIINSNKKIEVGELYI